MSNKFKITGIENVKLCYPEHLKHIKEVQKIRKPATRTASLNGTIDLYKKLYELFSKQNELYEPMSELGYIVYEAAHHCSVDTVKREYEVYKNVESAYKELINALEDALGIESTYTVEEFDPNYIREDLVLDDIKSIEIR